MSGATPHLVHGMGTELEAPAWPAILPDEADAVLAHFPSAGKLLDLQWHSPRPFSAATLARTSAGEFLLKRHHRMLRTPISLAEEHAFMAHLRSSGITVPDVVETADGASAIMHGEWCYELHGKAPGLDIYRDRQSWTPFLSSDHAREAGAALARLHRAARGFAPGPRGPDPLVASFTIVASRDPLRAAEIYVAARPALSAFLAGMPWRQELSRLFAALGDGLTQALESRASLWTHNDWHPSNLLWTPEGRVSAVFDFGLATRTCALHDIATAIERTAIPWLELDGGGTDIPSAVAFLAGYCTVRPLTRDDIEAVVRLLPLVHIEFALSEIDYFSGILSDRNQADLAYHGYLMGHAEWFISAAGQDFLGVLGSRATV